VVHELPAEWQKMVALWEREIRDDDGLRWDWPQVAYQLLSEFLGAQRATVPASRVWALVCASLTLSCPMFYSWSIYE